MDKSQMHFAKWKKQDSEGYLLCGCIHMSFYRQQSYMAMGNRSMVGEGFHCRVSTRACVWGGRTILWLLWWQFFYFLSQFYLFIYFTLQYCIDFAIHWHESAMGVHVFPILNPLPPPSPSQPSGSSQCTSPEHPVSCIKPGLAICFTYDIIHVSMPFSQTIPPSPSPTESKRLFYTSVSLLLSHIQGYHYLLSKFYIYVLVYCTGVLNPFVEV